MAPLVWIIIGVSGSGKSTVGRHLADKLECDFIEGDRRHPRENVEKMKSGVPLADADRSAWLGDLASEIARATAAGRELVISCSALKRSFRDQLKAAGAVQMLLPVVDSETILRRLNNRTDHYMPASLLQSQINAFEPPAADEEVWKVDGTLETSAIVDEVVERSKAAWPGLGRRWWERV